MSTQTHSGAITTSVENNIAYITFSHPAANSLPSRLLAALAGAFNALSTNADVNVIVLKSEGDKAFCAGASFTELTAIDNFETGTSYFSGFANVINAMRTCSKLIIGMVQGKAVGGGVGLVAACDYAIATENAAVRLSEFEIGIGPFVIAPAVERKTGRTAFAEMTLDAEWKDARWALSNGLFTKVVATTAELREQVTRLAEKISGQNPEALHAMKRILWEGTEDWDRLLAERAKISGGLVLSDFTRQALAKFK